MEVNTRYEWNQKFWEFFVMPAITGNRIPPQVGGFKASTLEDWKVEHFGQVLPIEDVEQVIDRVDSIIPMRLPVFIHRTYR